MCSMLRFIISINLSESYIQIKPALFTRKPLNMNLLTNPHYSKTSLVRMTNCILSETSNLALLSQYVILCITYTYVYDSSLELLLQHQLIY